MTGSTGPQLGGFLVGLANLLSAFLSKLFLVLRQREEWLFVAKVVCQQLHLQFITSKKACVDGLAFKKKLSNPSNHWLRKPKTNPEMSPEGKERRGLQSWGHRHAKLQQGKPSLKGYPLIKKRQVFCSIPCKNLLEMRKKIMEEVEVLETCLCFCTAPMPSVTFHSEPLGTAKVYRPLRRHKHSLLQPFQDRAGTRHWEGFQPWKGIYPENTFF